MGDRRFEELVAEIIANVKARKIRTVADLHDCKCPACMEALKRMSPLSVHPCPICGIRFNERSHLEDHLIKGHEGHGRYACYACPGIFKTENELLAHITATHE